MTERAARSVHHLPPGLGTPDRVTIMPGARKISCIPGCGACCIAPSLSSPIPGMPDGKPAGVRCAQLTSENLCAVFGRPDRPRVCDSYQATVEYCGAGRDTALRLLAELEAQTAG